MVEAKGLYLQGVGVAKPVKACSSETNYIGSSPGIGIYFFDMFYTHKQLNCAVTHPLFNYTFQKLSLLHWQG
jgi:hypothetical protein